VLLGPREAEDSQIRRTALFGLVVVGAGDSKGDAVLAGGGWVVGIFSGTADLACAASVAAFVLGECLREKREWAYSETVAFADTGGRQHASRRRWT
jgi:hypothetical protein